MRERDLGGLSFSMSSLKGHIEARKRRLQDLQSQFNKNVEVESAHNRDGTAQSKITESRLPDRSLLTSFEQEKKVLEHSTHTVDDEEAAEPKDDVTQHKNNKRVESIDSMRSMLEDKLQELDRRTDNEIKRIVRREFMEDAVNDGS